MQDTLTGETRQPLEVNAGLDVATPCGPHRHRPSQSWSSLLQQLERQEGLSGTVLCWIFLYAAAVVATREPDLLTNPQFYGEGGAWYAEAYNLGWVHSLFLTAGGYFAICPKLIVGLTLLVPLSSAPILMNICGILIQAMPVPILLSSRSSNWGTIPMRLLMAGAYVALPNAGEIHVVLTNAQWHLALVASLLLLAKPPEGWQGKALDAGVFLLCGLTGPFCLVLLPVAAVVWWRARSQWNGLVCGLFLATATLEGISLLGGGLHERGQAPLGATPLLLAKMVAGQVYLGALIGQNEVLLHAHLPAILLPLLIGTAILAWVSLKAEWELRLFILFCALLMAAELKSPLSDGPQPRWIPLANSTGGRYWFFPMLAFSWALIRCAAKCDLKPCRFLAMAGVAVMLWGEGREWKYPPFYDANFGSYVHKLALVPTGAAVKIPISPPGWTIVLKKKD